MHRVRPLDDSRKPVSDRGAERSASRSEPLTLIAGAVAGDDLQSVAATAAEALRCPVAIAIPALGEPVVHPAASVTTEAAEAIAVHSAAVSRGEEPPVPAVIDEAVPVRIGEQIVGIVAAVSQPTAEAAREQSASGARNGRGSSDRRLGSGEQRAWLEAAAAAASVTALMRNADGGAPGAAEALITELAAERPDDVPGLVARARRLGVELGAGAVAIAARRRPAAGIGTAVIPPAADPQLLDELRTRAGALVGEPSPGRIVALAPLHHHEGAAGPAQLATELRAGGLAVAVSSPRRDPAGLHDAVREALLLAELGTGPDEPAGQDETYRLLIGVLLRDPQELVQLRERTISPLAEYDAGHDTDLLATLRAFLVHDGSTTETAEAMRLHRHTVGYRLSRVHEVSGLSPYESDGRERLSLGSKAHDILCAQQRLELG
jgi:hypothetical protein